jgi:replicative DNA helicase
MVTDNFYRYAKRLLYLALLSQTGRNDSKKADKVRDELDLYYKDLTEKEINVVKKMSTLLYELEAD